MSAIKGSGTMSGLWTFPIHIRNRLLRVTGEYKKEKRVADAEVTTLFVIAAYRMDAKEIERAMRLYANCRVITIMKPEDLMGWEVNHYILSDRAHENKQFGEIMDVLNSRIR